MHLNDYQKQARKTAIYPHTGAIEYLTMGLGSEAGEVAGHVKRILRDDGGVLTFTRKMDIIKELGDCLYYIAMISDELEFSLADVAKINGEKLSRRKQQGTLKGSGDNR